MLWPDFFRIQFVSVGLQPWNLNVLETSQGSSFLEAGSPGKDMGEANQEPVPTYVRPSSPNIVCISLPLLLRMIWEKWVIPWLRGLCWADLRGSGFSGLKTTKILFLLLLYVHHGSQKVVFILVTQGPRPINRPPSRMPLVVIKGRIC